MIFNQAQCFPDDAMLSYACILGCTEYCVSNFLVMFLHASVLYDDDYFVIHCARFLSLSFLSVNEDTMFPSAY